MGQVPPQQRTPPMPTARRATRHAPEPEPMYVRIRKTRITKKGGHPKQHMALGVLFREEAGWYKVDPDTAEHLATRRVVEFDDNSALLFEVCTATQARAIDTREYEL